MAAVTGDGFRPAIAASSNIVPQTQGANNQDIRNKDWEMKQIKGRMDQFVKNVSVFGTGTLAVTAVIAHSNLPVPAKAVIITLIALASLQCYAWYVRHQARTQH